MCRGSPEGRIQTGLHISVRLCASGKLFVKSVYELKYDSAILCELTEKSSKIV